MGQGLRPLRSDSIPTCAVASSPSCCKCSVHLTPFPSPNIDKINIVNMTHQYDSSEIARIAGPTHPAKKILILVDILWITKLIWIENQTIFMKVIA